jgi:hypothetical protein
MTEKLEIHLSQSKKVVQQLGELTAGTPKLGKKPDR